MCVCVFFVLFCFLIDDEKYPKGRKSQVWTCACKLEGMVHIYIYVYIYILLFGCNFTG